MKKKRIVTIGGGTGSFMLLSGLKKYPFEISAIVSMADDGGSTGILRDELGVLPPGDVRQCLVALSDSKILRDLLVYRFENGGLKGHNFGNLFLSALEKLSGGFVKGVEEASKILNIKGEIIPVTDQDARLYMELNDKKIIDGEDQINHNYEIEKTGIKKMYFSPKVKANPKAIKRILEADIIIIGPGNHYCSILPNFLVKGIPEAILKSKAKVVYNCNLVNKKGHTESFDLDKYVDSVNSYLGGDRIDFVTFNTKKPSQSAIKQYELKNEILVKFNEKSKKNRNYKILKANTLSNKKVVYSKADTIASQRTLIRHDSDRLVRLIIKQFLNQLF